MKKYEIDMLNGNLFSRMIAFAFPLMLTGILQLLFNAVDIAIIGRFAGDSSLAAVGATTSIVNLFVNVFLGLSVGTNYMVATSYGAKNYEKIHRTVQTSVYMSLIMGIAVGILGVVFSKSILAMMNTPAEVIDKAAVYLRIYFVGMPALLVFNYAASVLRAVGDTTRPLIFLTIAGVVNLLLNIVFTVFLHMDVAGVALATVISETLAMIFIIVFLTKSDACYKFYPREVKIYKRELSEMIKIGIPSAVNGSLFSVSNMVIQSSINTFGAEVIAGSAVSASVEGFIFTGMDSMYHTTLAFTGQNYGAKRFDRLLPVLYKALIIVIFIGIGLGALYLAFDNVLFSIFTKSQAVIEAAKTRAWVIIPTYFMCGIMCVYVGSVRGYGYPVLPTFISALGVLAIRIIWVYTVFAKYNDIRLLFLSWGISYVAVIIAFIICHKIIHRRLIKNNPITGAQMN
ncbi:MAG: MATE family efflux transporter [Clostridia bacterium]|nr:MATE family efflux transporter [Clostridia bacterium]